MRTQTPSFIVKAKLHLQDNVKNHLNKSFHIADSAYNETLNFGLKLFSAMKKNIRYQELLIFCDRSHISRDHDGPCLKSTN